MSETTPIPETTTATYQVPEVNLRELETKLQKLIKKADKLSVGAISYSVDRENPIDVLIDQRRELTGWDDRGTEKFYRREFKVTVTGTIPRLAGWAFIATLDHMDVEGEVANVLRVVPGLEENLPAHFRTATPENCDHCQKRIKTRKNTFIVRSETTGEWKQVGSTCTQAFLGGLNPHDVAKMLEYVQLAVGGGWDFGGGGMGGTDDFGYGVETFLAATAAIIRKFGWLSRGKARAEGRIEVATANLTLKLLTPPLSRNAKDIQEWERFVAEVGHEASDDAEAKAAAEYIRDTIDFRNETNDFRYNLRVAFGQDVVYPKLAGIVAAGIMFYQREMLKLKEAEGLRKPTSQEYVGAIGDKVELQDVQLVFIKRLEGQFGGYDLAKFVTADGKSVTVFGQIEGAIGEFGSLVGKVSKQEVYKDQASTQVKGRTLFTSVARQAELAALKAQQKAEKKAAAKAARDAKKQEKAVQFFNDAIKATQETP